jgi:hypothetical protein
LNAIVAIVLIFLVAAAVLGTVAFVVYRRQLRKAKGIERGLKMVPILIHLPSPSDDTAGGSRDVREVMREKIAQGEILYSLIAGTAQTGFKSAFYGQRHIAFELIADDGLIHFYAAVPVGMVSVVEKAIMTAYPGARLEEVEDHNIFNKEGRIAGTLGGELTLKADTAYPIATFKDLERDPMEALLNTLSTLQTGDGAGIQFMLRPANPAWVKRSTKLAAKQAKAHHISGFSAKDIALAAVKAPEAPGASAGKPADLSNLEKAAIEAIEEKTKHVGYEVLIRVIVSTNSVARSQELLGDIATSFALFEAPGSNGFKFLPSPEAQGLVTAFIFRFFPPELTGNILNSVELATLFHLPDDQFTPSSNVDRQVSKQVDGPTSLPSAGLLFGYNEFRGVRKEIRLSEVDRRRHTYIIGQTGTGKSGMLENLVVQDMLNGNGFAFIDPHGDTAEKLMSMVPKERAEDVIYFNPADTDYPLGFNLFEFTDPQQKDFIIQESLNMLYKIYDPNGQGTIGPRFEQWYRNAALTLMSDPAGSTFIEIPKVFTDTEYLKRKFRYLKDPTVIEFWTKEMGQTSDYHKSEMLGYFVSKFGAFLQNEMMRNILGQTKSSFNLREVMDKKKILIVNLSKGQLGEMNSKLLGMMFVIKFQAAAMSRADMLEEDRNDFSLYVDEFQNFSTDSFASILSEARKYRLNLIVANQFIGQLTPEIRDAVFGNIGTIVAHRMGPEDAEFMVKQFTPVFDIRDLVNLPNFHAAMRLMVGGLPSQPFTISDLPYLKAGPSELREAIKQLSAAKFGATRAQVEAELFARLDGKPAPVVAPPATVQPAPVVAPPLAPAVAQAAPPPPAVPAKDPASLSLGDITGGKPAPASVPAPVPASAPIPAAAPVVPAPVAPPPAPVPVPVPAPVPIIPPVAPVTPPPAVSPTVPPIGAPPVPLAPPIGAPPVELTEPLDVALVPPGSEPLPKGDVPLVPPTPAPVPPKDVPLTPPPLAPPVVPAPAPAPVAPPKPAPLPTVPKPITAPTPLPASPIPARPVQAQPQPKPQPQPVQSSPAVAKPVVPAPQPVQSQPKPLPPQPMVAPPTPPAPPQPKAEPVKAPEPEAKPKHVTGRPHHTVKHHQGHPSVDKPKVEEPKDSKPAKASLIRPDHTDKPLPERDEEAEQKAQLPKQPDRVIEAPAEIKPAPPGPPEPVIPKLAPGEVYVDELGNVHQG